MAKIGSLTIRFFYGRVLVLWQYLDTCSLTSASVFYARYSNIVWPIEAKMLCCNASKRTPPWPPEVKFFTHGCTVLPG